MHQFGFDTKARSNYHGDDPNFHGDKTNATSKFNSTSQTEVSTKRKYSPGGIFSPKI
jgi:hypothetical protein